MEKFTITYKVEMEARDIDEAEDLAEKGEIKIKSRLERITGENGDVLEKVYDVK